MPSAPYTATYIKFNVTGVDTAHFSFDTSGSPGTKVQLEQFQLLNGNNILNLRPTHATALCNGTEFNSSQTAPHAINGVLTNGNKWGTTNIISGVPTLISNTNPIYLLITAATPVTFDQYQFITADDNPIRDPVTWTVSISDDGITYTIIDTQTDYPTTFARNAFVGPFLPPLATTTTLTSSHNGSVFGQSVIFGASVLGITDGSGTPSGAATFVINGTSHIVGMVSGQAFFSINSLSVGDHTITVNYSGSTHFQASSSSLTQTVALSSTTTTITSDVNPSVFDQSVTLTALVASVSPGSGIPTGTATFIIDGNPSSPINIVSGQAQLLTSALSIGSHTIIVNYGGDSDFQVSSGSLTQVVDRSSTTTTITSDVNPSTFDQLVTLTALVAAVSPGSGTPTGTATFIIDGNSSVVTLSSGQAILTTSALSIGSHTITVNYDGDSDFQVSSDSLTQVVTLPTTTTTITSDENPSVYGQTVTLTALVVACILGTGTPTGTATFVIDGNSSSPINIVSGQAILSASVLSIGSHTIVVNYSGDTAFQASSDSLVQIVNQSSTTTSLVSSGNPFTTQQRIQFTATIAPVLPGVGIPTGTVTFNFGDGSVTASVNLSSAIASIYHSYSTAGTYGVTSQYSGDTNFITSSSSLSQVIRQPFSGSITTGNYQQTIVRTNFSPLQVRILDINGQVVPGEPCTFTAPVNGASATFSNGSNFATYITNSNGMATSSTLLANRLGGTFEVIMLTADPVEVVFDLMNELVPCIASDSQILMANGDWKSIQLIERGDFVAGDSSLKLIYQVARLNSKAITEQCPWDLVIFQPSSLAVDCPRQKLIITGNHALIYDGARRPAKCFAEFPNVTRYYEGKIISDKYCESILRENTQIPDIYLLNDLLPLDHNVYDLQFETTGTYVVEGVIVQSRCPKSNLTPLPKELYFDQSLYSSEVMIDNPDQILPLDLTLLVAK